MFFRFLWFGMVGIFFFSPSLASLLVWVVYFIVYMAAPFALFNIFYLLPIKKNDHLHIAITNMGENSTSLL